ncbi:MAG: hypothetical protein U0T02_08945 [Solirubrobacteraceae bacterium]
MGVVITATAGLSIWIVLWALGIKSFDAFLIVIVMVLVAAVVAHMLPSLPGHQDDERDA